VHQSLAALFLERVAKSSAGTAVVFKEGKEPYRSMTWGEFGVLAQNLAFGLASMGLEPGNTAAVMSATSYKWVAADLSILCNAAVSVPIYPTSASGDVQHILVNSEAKFLFVQDEKLLAKVLKVRADVPNLKKVILMEPLRKGKTLDEFASQSGIDRDFITDFPSVCEAGERFSAERPYLIQERVNGIKFGDLATIIYTSGTTGTPKGVMLLNSTILSVIYDLPGIIPINEDDEYLSFLPLSHVFERVCGEFYWLLNGAALAFAEGMEHLPKNMQEAQPTVMLVVPRLLEKIYTKVMNGVQGASPRAQRLIHWALGVGREVVWHKAQGKPIRIGLEAKNWVADKLVFRKMRERIGKRLRMVVSGGAPGTPEVMEFFNAIGIDVLEGYGLTETAAPTNVNRIEKNKVGTVGPTLPSVQMRVAEDGEVLFKGPTICPGYFKGPEMTKEVFTDGWFHSGDIGTVDKDGYLKITDRKKDLIVNSAGKNIAPQKIEAVLRTVPFVSQAVVFGDKKKTLVALLTLEEQAVMEFAKEHGWNYATYRELSQSRELKRYLKNEISERSHNLADYEQVRNLAVLPEDLTVESGELTATMKIKRNVLKQKYKDVVEGLYREDSQLVGSR
jgi:long-chain acyl-CoA synthetase